MKRFEESFERPYAWAGKALSNNYSNFGAIEAGTDMSHFRPYYTGISDLCPPNAPILHPRGPASAGFLIADGSAP